MLTLYDFITIAIENKISNDAYDVWVTVEGKQYYTTVLSVLSRPENYPFEASYELERNQVTHSDCWLDMYNKYISGGGL